MNWQEVLLGDESISFLYEIAIRSFIMFLLIFMGLRVAGKRGVKQLSIFELLIIISLGSAAGDPMIYREIGLVSSLVAFIVVFTVYWLITKLVENSAKMEDILEGEPMYIIRNGKVSDEALKNKVLAGDEFFAELRGQNVSHMGLVKSGILETNGEVSLLLYKDEDKRPGLPVWPDVLNKKDKKIPRDGLFACTHCGNTRLMVKDENAICDRCKKNEFWVEAII